jgi:shikimate dehydrogenase
MTDNTSDQYCVFGNPIEHSRSPEIHHTFAHKSKQRINYQKILVPVNGFSDAILAFIENNGKGANVTVPFKEQAMALADQLSPRAASAGAVNTLTFKDGIIYGDNTDGEGLVIDLLANNVMLKQCDILLLGAGGAARGVILPLLSQQPKSIVIANRTVSKADKICHQFADQRLTVSSYTDVANKHYDLIINATSASLAGDLPPISSGIINNQVVCYDMMYGKGDTAFIEWAKCHGAKNVIDGLGMLVGQAAASFNVWRGVIPEIKPVIEQLRKTL